MCQGVILVQFIMYSTSSHKFAVRNDVQEELRRLSHSENTHKFCKPFLYDPVFVYGYDDEKLEQESELKIVYLNINGLLHADHLCDLDNDHNLKEADIICIAESKIYGIDTKLLKISGFTIVANLDFQPHSMGLVLYKNDQCNSKLSNDDIFIYNNYGTRTQIIRCKIYTNMISFVYIHPSHINDGLQFVKEVIQRSDCVLGDFNIDSRSSVSGVRSKLDDFATDFGMVSALDVLTRDTSAVDHVLVPRNVPYKYICHSYKNLYSDHRAISLRISNNATGFIDNI